MRSGTTRSRSAISGEVLAVCCMPADDEVSFFWSLATQTSTRISGQCVSVATCTAIESSPPFAAEPATHLTHPPYMERHAEPEPMRAIVESSPCTAYICASANASVAYPAADDARPAAVGKLFSLTMRTLYAGHAALGTSTRPEASTLSLARSRTSRSTACVRLLLMSSRSPLSQISSSFRSIDARIDVVVERSSMLRVAESDELSGMMSSSLALPQYLIVARFGAAMQVTESSAGSASPATLEALAIATGAPPSGAP
eukprot:Amastigsp_a676841_52.p3 type:complete len:258 gc:universal Amastigsp_a676841_52:1017-244(-)